MKKDKNGLSKTYEHIRQSLKNGLKINPQTIDDSCDIFLTIDYKNNLYSGIWINSDNYQFENGKIKAILDENSPDTLFAKLVTICADEMAFNGITLPGTQRNIALAESFKIFNDKFPLVDLVSIGKKLIKNYFDKSSSLLGVNFTKEQIGEILKSADTPLGDYAIASESTVEMIFSDSGVVEALHRSITGMGPGDIAIEKFLSRNVDFQEMCCEKVRDSVCQSIRDEIEAGTDEVSKLHISKNALIQDCKALGEEKNRLKQEVENKEKLNKEIRELHFELETLRGELNNEKKMFIDSLIVESFSKTNPEKAELIMKEYPCQNLTVCDGFEDLIKKLKINLKNTLDTPYSINDLAHYMLVSLRKGMNIIVCNDPYNVIANCISSLIDGKMCTSVDCTKADSSDIIQSINGCQSTIITINGAFNSLDYSKYFSLCRYSNKCLLFTCDDLAVLSSAPPEIWYCSLFLNLENFSVKCTQPTFFSEYSIVPESIGVQEINTEYVDSLEDYKIITPMQASHLRDICAKIGSEKTQLISDYVRQLAKSNQTLNEFERIPSNE